MNDTTLRNLIQTQTLIILASTQSKQMMIQSAMMALDDEEEQQKNRRKGGSSAGRQPNLPRDFEAGYQLLMKHYFSRIPLYPPHIFRQRFRMYRELFLKITNNVTDHNPYFLRKRNAVGQLGLYPIQKVASALRMLAYGGAADSNDEYIQIAKSTSLESLDCFCNAIIQIYGDEYLQSPNEDDVRRLLDVGEQRGFPGMLGLLDCMHWQWKNCPTAWAGQFTGKEKVCFLILLFSLKVILTYVVYSRLRL
jgi:hypothetical protein